MRRFKKHGHKTASAQKGITLVEMLVVIFIIGLVSAIALQNLLPERDRSIQRKAQADIAIIESALEQYNLNMLEYPSTQQGLAALQNVPNDALRKDQYREGGYLRRLPEDPWGRPYQYRFPGENSVFDVFTLGADGEVGGSGSKADIGNWTIR